MIVGLNLLIASTVERYCFRFGASSISIDQDTIELYMNQLIYPEIDESRDNLHIFRSQCIKFLMIFRNYIPIQYLPDVAKKLGSLLGNQNAVVRVYAACALEKLLSMQVGQSRVMDRNRNGGGFNGKSINKSNFVFTKSMIKDIFLNFLQSLNELINNSEGLNKYAIMALFRLVTIAQEDFNPYALNFAEVVGQYVDKCLKDSSTNAYSIYVLFETIGYILFNLHSTNQEIINEYEISLTPYLNKVIMEN
jgi:hypothetical protein